MGMLCNSSKSGQICSFLQFLSCFEQNQLKIVKNMQINTFLSQLWRAPQHSRLIFGPKYLNGRYFKIKASKTRSMNQKGLSLIFGPSPFWDSRSGLVRQIFKTLVESFTNKDASFSKFRQIRSLLSYNHLYVSCDALIYTRRFLGP